MKMLCLITIFFALCVSSIAESNKTNGPDCSGHWPTIMTFVHMKNAAILTNQDIDSTKTKTDRLASQKIGKDLWRQVYDITFTKKSGETIEAIAVHDASTEECSMSGVEVFVVSKHLNPDRK